ncbi:hypothetical protein Tco_0179042 [Tanacetum coccineum]
MPSVCSSKVYFVPYLSEFYPASDIVWMHLSSCGSALVCLHLPGNLLSESVALSISFESVCLNLLFDSASVCLNLLFV